MSLLAFVHFNNFLGIDGQIFVGVYNDTEKTRICLLDRKVTFNISKCKEKCFT